MVQSASEVELLRAAPDKLSECLDSIDAPSVDHRLLCFWSRIVPDETSAECVTTPPGWNFDNTYARLPQLLFKEVEPEEFSAPRVALLNRRVAKLLGLSFTDMPESDLANLFSGQQLPPGARPIAQAYAGHQFGGFTMLGDGRAVMLGEHRAPDGTLYDIQFKGSGRTPYSRQGDGRAALGPMLREYIISEAMAALNIPTTLSLAVVTTGDPVYRETALQGAVLTRVAASHIRVGTFQFLAGMRDEPALRALADYAIQRHDPSLAADANKYTRFLKLVIERQASLIASWQLVGFIHGVMNTDNMAISGETIDYGPCAFMDTYHPATVFSSIDQQGRYAYGNQPAIGQWNLARLAETLLPLLDEKEEQAIDLATEMLNEYPAIFERYWLQGMRRKLGLQTETADDPQLVEDLLTWMESAEADFTNTFDDLTENDGLQEGLYADEGFQSWYARWQTRIAIPGESPEGSRKLMRSANPAVIARNHRVEEALTAATQNGDLSVTHKLVEALSSPFARNEAFAEYRSPPPPGSPRYRTFCGT